MTAFTLPKGACDTHVHVFLPELYPYASDRAYTPGRITPSDLSAFLAAHGLDRVVIVQPSVYGTDNRALLDGLAELGRRARGIAVIDIATVTDAELQALAKAGVSGIRLNVATREQGGLADAAARAAERLAGSGWAIQIYAPLADIVASRATLARLRQPVILDHFGGARIDDPELASATDTLIDLARNGPAYIKVSAPSRVSDNSASGWPDVAPLAVRLIAAAPNRVIWGSDWPHTGGQGRSGRPPGPVYGGNNKRVVRVCGRERDGDDGKDRSDRERAYAA